jgi:hypothetical protein
MADDPRTEPLREWNRLARENTENAIVSSMFEAAAQASAPLERFSDWLLIGAAAVASFMIANSDKVLPLLGVRGFSVCGAFLCLSCVFGLLSKVYALLTQIGNQTGDAVRRTFAEHLAKYEEEERKIQEGAAFWQISLQTGVRLERILTEFFRPLPRWVAWFAKRHFQKHAGDPQIGYLILVSRLNKQGYFATGQAISFVLFLGSGFIYAAANAP